MYRSLRVSIRMVMFGVISEDARKAKSIRSHGLAEIGHSDAGYFAREIRIGTVLAKR